MNRKSIWVAGFAGLFVVSMIAASSVFTDVSGETSEKPTVPRYSETCAHGHNGYDCNSPQYRVDISELQERADELEKRVSQLERSR